MAPSTHVRKGWIQWPLGIPGLDKLLRGGLECPPPDHDGLIFLLKGRAGTGKTTLALQIALAARKWKRRGGRAIDISNNEQPTSDVLQTLNRLSGEDKEGGDQMQVCGRGYAEAAESAKVDENLSSLAWVRERVVQFRREERHRRSHRLTIIDGLNLVGSSERHLLEVEKVMDALRKRAQVGIVIFEPNDDDAGPVDFHADVILELEGDVTAKKTEYFLHHLRIQKSRFQSTVLGWHQYKIADSGLKYLCSTAADYHFT